MSFESVLYYRPAALVVTAFKQPGPVCAEKVVVVVLTVVVAKLYRHMYYVHVLQIYLAGTGIQQPHFLYPGCCYNIGDISRDFGGYF